MDMESDFHKIRSRIDAIYAKNKMVITGKKKKKILLKDGFITYQIDIENLKCPCGQRSFRGAELCDHLLCALTKKYRLSDMTITFITVEHILKKFKELLKKPPDNFNNKLEPLVKDYLKNTECGICLDNLLHML